MESSHQIRYEVSVFEQPFFMIYMIKEIASF